MDTRKRFSIVLLVAVMTIALVNCEDNMLEKKSGTVNDRSAPGNEANGPDDRTGGDRGYPYPEIIEREFIPPDRSFAHMKCLAWRITWPVYDDDVNEEMIPTVFSTANGELNSFNFLNNSSPLNTYNGHFSLYHLDKVEAANSMWSELDWVFDGFSEMVAVCFAEGEITELDHIIHWVTERPSLFEIYWKGTCDTELEYNEGDFIQFQLNDDGIFRYGGVRIVSMTPRIIEVYLAVPNV